MTPTNIGSAGLLLAPVLVTAVLVTSVQVTAIQVTAATTDGHAESAPSGSTQVEPAKSRLLPRETIDRARETTDRARQPPRSAAVPAAIALRCREWRTNDWDTVPLPLASFKLD